MHLPSPAAARSSAVAQRICHEIGPLSVAAGKPPSKEKANTSGGARFVRPARAQETATRYAQSDVQTIESTLDEMLLKTGVSHCRQAADL